MPPSAIPADIDACDAIPQKIRPDAVCEAAMPELHGPLSRTSSYNESGADPPARRQLFRQEVLEFQQHNRQWGRVVPLPPLPTRVMVWSVFAAAAGVITFLFFAQYARKEIAPGYLAPVSGTARVYAPQPGTISIVHVRQG